MVSIEIKSKIEKYLQKAGGSNLTEMLFATRVCNGMETLRKWVRILEKQGMLDVKKEYGGDYWITLKKVKKVKKIKNDKNKK